MAEGRRTVVTQGEIDGLPVRAPRVEMRAAARAALEEKAAAPLGMDADRARAGALAVLNATLTTAIKFALFQRGLDPRDFAPMSFGGAGGLHACEVADGMGMTTAALPHDPSTSLGPRHPA